MNKTTCKDAKAHLATKFFLLSLLSFLLLSFFSIKNDKDDDEILKYCIEQKIKNYSGPIYLYSKNNNEYLLSVISEIEVALKTEGETKKDSIYNSYNIKNSTDYNLIFNSNEFDYFKSQKDDSNWKLNDTKYINIVISSDKRKANLFVSKPLYTKSKEFALVSISNKTSSYVVVLKYIDGKWIKYKFFNFFIH